MFDFINNMTARISNLILQGADSRMSDKEFIEREIAEWKNSPRRIMQIKGHLYYENEHDILSRKRTMIGEDGKLQEVDNLPNNRIIDNQYGKLVNQKANYLLGQPFVIEGKNEQYIKLLKKIFNKRFMKTLKNAGKSALNGGISWLYPYYNETGEFSFRLFPGYEILPFWKDSEHTMLDCAVRLYLVSGYEGTNPVVIEKVEIFDMQGIHCYVLDSGRLIPDTSIEEQNCSYVINNGVAMNWEKIPLIPLKYNENEIPLLKRVKSLQDGINIMLSDFENNMQEDARNTILVLKNFDGQNLGEFRKNLATFGAVKVRYDGETKGGVETLEVTVNADNYKAVIEIFKKALIENGMGYDAKDDRLSGNPNQMNIQSMYSDIDLDANDMETELQAAFEEILWFINAHLFNTGQGNFDNEEVNIIFNRDILINESEAISNCQASVGILSDETIVGQHPWVDDPQAELERLEKQKQKEQEEIQKQQYDPFASRQPGNESGVLNEE
ncbi:phage portal protein [Porcipelethomonas sp.]|uniref:phage portal protein n=1 Tax=Porcipelethomonas sp. TaxID=2981675 RepID=UPI003EF3E315